MTAQRSTALLNTNTNKCLYIILLYIFPIYVLLIAEEKEKANIVAHNASFVTCVKASMLKSVLRRQA